MVGRVHVIMSFVCDCYLHPSMLVNNDLPINHMLKAELLLDMILSSVLNYMFTVNRSAH